MRIPARAARAALFFLPPAALGAGACETDAVGIQECREIERARCEAARGCNLGIDSDEDLATCERFARDGCLRGLVAPSPPKSNELEACVRAIRVAGTCALDDAKSTAADCLIRAVSTTTTACEIVQTPEDAVACAFLLREPEPEPEPEPPEDAGAD